jgi:hypothetical protein
LQDNPRPTVAGNEAMPRGPVQERELRTQLWSVTKKSAFASTPFASSPLASAERGGSPRKPAPPVESAGRRDQSVDGARATDRPINERRANGSVAGESVPVGPGPGIQAHDRQGVREQRSAVMDDARAVAERRKRQLGFGHPQ